MRERRGSGFGVIALIFLVCVGFSYESFASSNSRRRKREAEDRQAQEIHEQAEKKFNADQAMETAANAQAREGYINHYLRETLRVDPKKFNLTLNFLPRAGLAERVFSPSSKETISDFFSSLGATSYNNPIIIGEAGTGKSFTINQLIAIFSYGKWPEYLNDVLGVENPLMAKVQKAFIGENGNTDFILVNNNLLGKDPTQGSEAIKSQELRMTQVLDDLVSAAEKQFKTTGRRTIFLVEEVGNLKEQVQEDLKSILDKTGFKDPDDPYEKLLDVGYSFAPITTTREYERMLAKDPMAVRRRYIIVKQKPIPEDELITTLMAQKEKLKNKFSGLDVDPEVLTFLVEMRKSLNSPPLAEPASSLRDLDFLYNWFAQRVSDGGKRTQITLLDAQKYVYKKIGLSDAFLPGPNGEPPLYDLAERLKKYVVGQDVAVERFALSYQTAFLFGRRVPGYLMPGPSASGKNTFVDGVTAVLSGPGAKPIKFSIGGKQGFAMDAILNGPPLGNHSDSELPLLLQKMNQKATLTPVELDESGDAKSNDLLKLKEFIEDAAIRPNGLDSEVRYLTIMPIFVLGEHGTEFFKDAKSDEDVKRIYENLTQAQIDEALMNPQGDPTLGHFSRSTIQRFKQSGGDVIMLRPVLKDLYPSIVALRNNEFMTAQKRQNNLDIVIDPGMNQEIAKYTIKNGEDPRGLGATFTHFVEYALTRAANKGLPYRNATIRISATNAGISVMSNQNGEVKVTQIPFSELFPGRPVPLDCATKLAAVPVKSKKVVNE